MASSGVMKTPLKTLPRALQCCLSILRTPDWLKHTYTLYKTCIINHPFYLFMSWCHPLSPVCVCVWGGVGGCFLIICWNVDSTVTYYDGTNLGKSPNPSPKILFFYILNYIYIYIHISVCKFFWHPLCIYPDMWSVNDDRFLQLHLIWINLQ